ncbi:MAG: carbon starvation protein A [Acidobacteria bacterium 13_2_20CM_2_57_6]|nr:MAG: carbon starvation protein A [Acidobacteria bacterium 13_2_20CM_57_7]OLB82295.1 MAG: carbon starvation protein A [Acidobacteria bacterium 13_2_20CM_2_57_6]PYT38582.1 MAG: carbon starvation protein A [Acidobacteriota bacterium]PYT39119.1 MAG: carbon starvation protein A [Acidobacteriota bacterium]PYT57296.1 MAG: carbon starvation protein A [Acidobacteriota bacterium]
MNRIFRVAGWMVLGTLGAGALGAIALHRGEPLNATWFVVAAVCCYLVAYRLYSAFVAAKILALDDTRATPCERHDDGRDFVPTNKWVLFGHHFAAIAGPGPLVGPTLAAQFGYLPGTLWLIAGAAFAGCVQDFVILFCSIRRDGKSIGQMAREEVSERGGFIAQLAVLAIMTILLAVIGLVVVNALKSSPWATFTLAMTIPIALLLGLYLRFVRPGRVLEASIMGVALVLFVVVAGQWVADSPSWSRVFTLSGVALAFAIIAYGFAASALPVWLLLAPRDYLSAFIKAGAIFSLAAGILFVRPQVLMPPLTRFIDGTGPVFAGKIFPFCFITIACGAISGFHSLISSGTTPKMILRESHARFIGYGAMLLESFVGVMAMVAACAMPPGVYFAINSPPSIVGSTPEAVSATMSGWGYTLAPQTMPALAHSVGELTLYNRAGGAPSLAVGMAQIFSSTIGGERLLSIWYHFAIMFEALFILTVLDAGTRVGRFMVQDLGGRFWKPFGRTGWMPGVLVSSAIIVALWGYFLYQGVVDPLGGINSLWPLFGISNQLLAAVALVVATTILMKMGRLRWIWVTLLPMAWLVTITMIASYQKIFDVNPRIGFLAYAKALAAQVAAGKIPAEKIAETQRLIFNQRLDAAVTGVLAAMILVLIVEALVDWYAILSRRKESVLHESPYVATRWAADFSGAAHGDD